MCSHSWNGSARCRSRWHADRKAALLKALDEALLQTHDLLRELREGRT